MEVFEELRDKCLVNKIQNLLLDWYQDNSRDFPWRNDSLDSYQLVVTEILLQQTRAETVNTHFESFFEAFPSWNSISSAKIEDLENALKPLGIWRRRAKTLSRLARVITSLERMPTEENELRQLPGFGQYVTNAYLLLVAGRRKPLLDTNMARVIERVFGPRTKADIRHDPHIQQTSKMLVDHLRSKEINWAILDLGAKVCVPRNPRCEDCPINKFCIFNKTLS